MAENTPNPNFDDLEALLNEAEQRKSEFLAAWQDSKTPRLEYFLPDMKSLAYEVVLLSLIGVEQRELARRGQITKLEDWIERFPYSNDLIGEHWESLSGSKAVDALVFSQQPAVKPDLDPMRAALGAYQLREKVGEGRTNFIYRCSVNRESSEKPSDIQHPSVVKVLRKEFLDRFSPSDRERWIAQWVEANLEVKEKSKRGLLSVLDAQSFEDGALVRVEQSEPVTVDRVAQVPIDQVVVAKLFQHLVISLREAHEANLFHGALRSSKLMKNEQGAMQINGVGFVKAYDNLNASWRLHSKGRRNHMSPELLASSSALSPECDIYSVGAIIYQILTGIPPRGDLDAVQELSTIPTNRPVPLRRLNPAIGRAFERIVDKCLEASPARRYPTMTALQCDIEELLIGPPRSNGIGDSLGSFWRRFWG